MKIGIDISNTVGEKTGIGYYTSNLVHSLAQIDKKNTYILYPFFYFITNPLYKTATKPAQKNFYIKFEHVPKIIVDKIRLSFLPKRWIFGDVDILHSTTYSSPKDHYGKLIVTIYDISFITFPHFHTDINRNHCEQEIMNAIKYADTIISISEHGRSELLRHYDIDPDIIQVTPLAAHDRFRPVNDYLWADKYQIPSGYILFIGTLEPRKNLQTLLMSYLSLPPEIKRKHKLVIAGNKGWLNNEIEQQIILNREDIMYLGYVPEEDLPSLYSGALFFVYPSYYEGFGLPIIEAMACGTPVITSNTSSMPEIAGDAALFFNPDNGQELFNAIMLLIHDEGLRHEMSWKGIIQAAQYSWEKTARKTLKIYEETDKKY
jgi:glycosyltransferase involved in cell wall biosynthesis